MSVEEPHVAAARIIQDADGELVGRTRLQKVAYLCQLAGYGKDFNFEYRHYGPFSEDLALGMEIAAVLGPVKEVERQAEWGGRYSIYTLPKALRPSNPDRAVFIQQAKKIGAVELELAATAAFLFSEKGETSPWAETARRKPDKSGNGRLQNARQEYDRLRAHTGNRLPKLPTS